MGLNDIKQELVVLLRNGDIISTSIRGVTTSQDTGTFASASSHTLATNPTLVKNIRNITIGGTGLNFGVDYTVNYSTGVISFTSPQTGAYVINYDTGNDKIYPDFPRDDLRINSYPRIAVDIMSGTTDAFGIGGQDFISNYIVTIVVYEDNVQNIDTKIQSIKQLMINNATDLYNISFVKPISIGPIISSPERTNEIMQRNIDFQIMFDVEEAV